MPDVFTCEVVGNDMLTDFAFAVTASCGGLVAQTRPGQFIHIRCGGERLLRRPFGVCSVHGDALRFVFEVKGEGTRWLSMRKPGSTLDILGPLGNGYSIPEGDVIVVGGGLGAPPMLFAAETAKGRATAVLGFRDSSRIILSNEFEEACDKVYITTDDGSFGICGTVAAPLSELLKSGRYSAVLACGQRAMLLAVAAICKNYGIPCQVSMEERMGCGVGACMVCACATVIDGAERMSRVCKDGPVFDANDVVW